MTPIQALQVKQANTLTQQSPTLGGFQVNNGQFDVISAQEGDKLQPQNGTYNKLISVFKHMIPGFREAVDMKNKRLEAQRNYDALQKANYRVRVPFQEPDNTPQQPIRFEASNRKPSYQEGGEMADNTRVQHIPNNGEAIYERTPVGYGDFLPLVGTYRAAQRIDNREPNANYGDLIVNGAIDLLGAGMVGPVVKAAGKANKIGKALKSRGFIPGSKEGIYVKQGATGTINRASGNVKQVPTVDFTNVAMQPLIQTLRVPATAPFK